MYLENDLEYKISHITFFNTINYIHIDLSNKGVYLNVINVLKFYFFNKMEHKNVYAI